jgi:Tol biopolymer transport system component
MINRKVINIAGFATLFLTFLYLYGYNDLKFYTDVFVWYPDGQLNKISPGDVIYFQPCIHPQGTHVVYYGNSTGTPCIWKADLNSYEIVALTSSEANARHPVFDWTGNRIAFSSDHVFDQPHERVEDMTPSGDSPPDSYFNIFIMDSNGTNLKQITKGPYHDERPCFSPDGKYVTFVSNRKGKKNGLWTLPADGSGEPKSLLQNGWGYRPWYSTDGRWIFFYTDINKRHRICKIPAEGGKVIPLPNDNFKLSHGPYTDPNGKVLLVHAIKTGNFHGIWEIPLNGDPPRKLKPPGFKKIHHGHAARAKNGIITFDALRFKK